MKILICMGVSGSGKTSLGHRLAAALDYPYFDGDDFHPPENVRKMSQGIPLSDDDRWAWLSALRAQIVKLQTSGRGGVISCSALKQVYRDILKAGDEAVLYVFLKGDYELIYSRMQKRAGHYMRAEMLASQFRDLEEPQDAIQVDISRPLDVLAEEVLRKLE